MSSSTSSLGGPLWPDLVEISTQISALRANQNGFEPEAIDVIRDEQDDLFRRWLSSPLEIQIAEFAKYLNGDLGVLSASRLICLIVPISATVLEVRLCECILETLCAAFSNECGLLTGSRDWRVGLMLDHLWKMGGRIDLQLIDLRRELCLTEHQIGFIFKKCTGMQFRRYLSRLRIVKAVELLKQPTRSVQEVSGLLGYSDVSNLGRDFRCILGTSPAAVRSWLFDQSPKVFSRA